MANDNKSTDKGRFSPQDQRPYSARLFLVIVAIILIVIGIGFFMMLFENRRNPVDRGNIRVGLLVGSESRVAADYAGGLGVERSGA
ncbi:MAG: hypothetical protein ACTHLX_16015, partial [Candidatus Binatia bacterium]